MKAGADLIRPFPHPRKPPVAVAARLYDLRVDSTPVIPDQHSQVSRRIFELHYDMFRMGVAEGVNESFPADSVHLVPEQRVQGPLLPVHDDAKSDILARRALRDKLLLD
jgi:hypothetical protein